ncbi:GIY-YIG nuclease family protein [Bacillus sp. UNC41MFS5]|uniref:GIY-YIG nuclease family protein n=1 Tax=Bacillus sp. UNC41MFS5 TaxID=1449046 RepID=UPI000479D486|nr:GIY-YIG nuclease family protein [Bacillus sp. UNC41MFS5]
MYISQLLKDCGLDITKKIKIVRHKDGRGVDIQQLHQSGQLALYQSYQELDVFRKCDYIVSLIGLDNTKALLVGVYEVKSSNKVKGFPEGIDVPYRGVAKTNCKYHYDLVPMPRFENLIDRVIVEWGDLAIVWHQWLHTGDKEVVQVLPKGHVEEFPGYLEFVLDYSQLTKLYEYPDSNQVWKRMLSTVAGIYLIVDKKTGMQYIGSASGKEGIYGRWKDYAKTGHGGNKTLLALLEGNPRYVHNFQYTILHTLAKTLTKNEVLQFEKKYKEKLGTKANGLNLN